MLRWAVGTASWHTPGWIPSRLCSSWLRASPSVRETSQIWETSLKEVHLSDSSCFFPCFQVSRWTTWLSTSSGRWSCVWSPTAGPSWTTPTTAATADTEAPAHLWMIWTGQYFSAEIPGHAAVQPVWKVCCNDCLGAAKCTTSVTVTPCSIPSAGPSWTTPTPKFTTTPAMRPTRRSPVAVSISPMVQIWHFDTEERADKLDGVYPLQARTMRARCSSASATARRQNALAGHHGFPKTSTCPARNASKHPSIHRCICTILLDVCLRLLGRY